MSTNPTPQPPSELDRELEVPQQVVRQIVQDYQRHLVTLLQQEILKLQARLDSGDVVLAHRARLLRTISLIEGDAWSKPYYRPVVPHPETLTGKPNPQ